MEDIIKGAAINSKGYGIIPKLVMQDRDLSITAKAIYAYLASYSGSGDSCFPSRDRVCYDLGIGKDTFIKHLVLLKDKGYVTVLQMKENGRFSHNVYTLNSEILPCTEIKDTENSDTAVKDTNNNSININSINNNSVSLSIEDTNVSSLSKNKFSDKKYTSKDIVDLYHNICKSYPKVKALSEKRKTAIKVRLNNYGYDAIKEVFEKAEASDFLRGKNSRNWTATFDWLIVSDNNFCKVLDGNYDNGRIGSYGNGGGNTGYSKQYTERTSENPNVDCSWIHSTKL